MTIRLYIAEDSMDKAMVRALQARGVDVTTALDEGMIERDDAGHLDYATGQGRVLYSFNVGDFYRLHTSYLTQGKPHAGSSLRVNNIIRLGSRPVLSLSKYAPAAEAHRSQVC